MQADNNARQFDYMNLVDIIIRRKKLIGIPTACILILTLIYCLATPFIWNVDMLILPSKFLAEGQSAEVILVDPKQISSQINQGAYTETIAAALNISLNKFPVISSENIRDTKLIRIWVREKNVPEAKKILTSLFSLIKAELDKKVDIELNYIDTQISAKNTDIKQRNIDIKDKNIDIALFKIQKSKTHQAIATSQVKIKISQDRRNSLTEELRSVKSRIDQIESQMRKSLEEKSQTGEAVALLLYSNEVQNNLRYYNTLEEKNSQELGTESILQLEVQQNGEVIKEIEERIAKTNNDIEKINNDIGNIKKEIDFLIQKKARYDYSKMIKEPTSSNRPVEPNIKVNLSVAGVLGLSFFVLIALFLEYRKKQRQ